MYKYFVIFCVLINGSFLYAKCSEIAPNIKNNYASNMHYAFVSQSLGQSTLASAQFGSAYDEAKKAGESILKLIAVEQLFIWYRMYGSSLNLFSKKPTGNERIIGEYKPTLQALNSYPPFKSEWGKTPDQAAQMREFMFGVGETIAGIFCATVSPAFGGYIAYGIIADGTGRIFSSLNNIWAGHQAMIALKNWEQTSLKAIEDKSPSGYPALIRQPPTF